MGKIFFKLPDNYDVKVATDRTATKEIPLIQQQVLEKLGDETLGLVATAWAGLQRMVYAERPSGSRLIRKLVKNFVNRVISEAGKASRDMQDGDVVLFELAGLLRAYVDKARMFDDRSVARAVAAGLDDQELESDVRRWASGLPEAAPPIFPVRVSAAAPVSGQSRSC